MGVASGTWRAPEPHAAASATIKSHVRCMARWYPIQLRNGERVRDVVIAATIVEPCVRTFVVLRTSRVWSSRAFFRWGGSRCRRGCR